ncbi:MAG: response regulator [Gammaproteobacteria bacterium]|nr:response regulator [Gammaproteobacteria bacterium]MDX2460816.1 response regulator [Gammaproteobacteria bacterium]
MANQDVVDALCAELQEGESELAGALAAIVVPDAEESSVIGHIQRYADYLRRFANAADMLDLPAVKELAGFFESNALALVDATPEDRGHVQRQSLFAEWPRLLSDFLAKADDTSSLGRLMLQTQDPAWPLPMDEEHALDLAERLLSEVQISDGPQNRAQSPSEATSPKAAREDDVGLSFSDDINPQLVNAFLHETPQHVNKLSQCVQRIAGNQAGIDDISQAQRVAHTIKGSANITGVAGIANLTHRMEDILEYFASQELFPPQGLGDTLLDASDCLEVMVEHLLGMGEPPAQSQAVLRRLIDWAERIERGELMDLPESDTLLMPTPEEPTSDTVKLPASALPTAPVEPEPTVVPAAPPPVSSVVPAAQTVSVKANIGAETAALRVPIDTIDNLLRLAGEMATSIVQIQGRQQQSLIQATALDEQNVLVQQRLAALQDLVQLRGVPSSRRELLAVAGMEEDEFDPLELDEYSELHSATNAFAEALTDSRELADLLRGELNRLDGLVTQHEQVSSELNQVVLSSRLIPVSTMVPRLQRGVRQTCRATGKNARLSVTGDDMLIDSEILSNIVDPLMHIVRNAVDHGIERPSERIANGKDEHGNIDLSFAREGESVVIRCRDDGAGFDFLRIRELVTSQGLVSGDHHVSDRELARLTLIPGFTTRRGTTQVSGRGIGMDVVNRSIADLRGTMDIDSTSHAGSVITLRVPLTMISMHVLLIRVGERIFGVPSSTLEQALFSDAGPVVNADDEWIFRFADSDYVLRNVSELVGMAGPAVSTLADRVSPLLLIRTENGPVGVIVDELVDGRYLVVTRLRAFVPRVRGVIGASILADGSVAPVLDVHELLRQPVTTMVITEIAEPQDVARNRTNVLVVDDSLSARRTLAQVISDVGYEPRTAVDGLDAIDAIEERLPDLILLDLEMPRMNGLELAAHLRSDQLTQDIPIVMVTSRSTAKHREQAHAAGIDAFITKPYLEDQLADQIRLLISPR